MSKKSRTRRVTMTKRIGHTILDVWDLVKRRKPYKDPVGINFNMDVSNNKRRMKIRIYIQPEG